MIGKTLGMFKWVQVVFMAGTAFGMLMGMFAGAGLGAVIGILFAPKEGKKLREEMKDAAGHLVEDVQQRGQVLKNQINEAFSSKPNGVYTETH
jgi:gas vesicle protein